MEKGGNLLREGVNAGDEIFQRGKGGNVETGNLETRGKGGNVENGNLEIPKPDGNKGTQSSKVPQQQFPQSPQSPSSTFSLSTGFHVENVENEGGKNSPQGFHLADLSPQQLSQLGMFRDGKGDYFHVSNTEDGGYRLSPATQESVAGAVAGVQRQAQRSQQQTQQNDQSALMKKISENAVDQFQVNIQAIVRKELIVLKYTWDSHIYRAQLNTCTCTSFNNCYYTRNSNTQLHATCDL